MVDAAHYVARFREASTGLGRAGTADWPGGPYMAMGDAAAVYADLMMGGDGKGVIPIDAPVEGMTSGEGFLSQLRRVNTERYHAWVGDGEDAGILFDAAELGGEVGELLNVVKKLEREARDWRGSRAAPKDFADECADVLICLDKLARRRGVDLEAATVAKFNATSDKQGFPHKLTASPATPAGSVREAGARLVADVERLAGALESITDRCRKASAEFNAEKCVPSVKQMIALGIINGEAAHHLAGIDLVRANAAALHPVDSRAGGEAA